MANDTVAAHKPQLSMVGMSMLASIRMGRSTVRACTPGAMGGSMSVSTKTESPTATANFFMRESMVGRSMLAHGRMEKSMGAACTLMQTARSIRGYGLMEKVSVLMTRLSQPDNQVTSQTTRRRWPAA